MTAWGLLLRVAHQLATIQNYRFARPRWHSYTPEGRRAHFAGAFDGLFDKGGDVRLVLRWGNLTRELA